MHICLKFCIFVVTIPQQLKSFRLTFFVAGLYENSAFPFHLIHISYHLMNIISICLFFVFGINNEAVRFPIIIRISGKAIVFCQKNTSQTLFVIGMFESLFC